MKIPKRTKRYCPRCRERTEQKIDRVKTVKGTRGALKRGQRRHNRRSGITGYGGYPKPKMEKGNKYGAKTSKKVSLIYTCEKCKKKTISKKGKRLKKVESK